MSIPSIHLVGMSVETRNDKIILSESPVPYVFLCSMNLNYIRKCHNLAVNQHRIYRTYLTSKKDRKLSLLRYLPWNFICKQTRNINSPSHLRNMVKY